MAKLTSTTAEQNHISGAKPRKPKDERDKGAKGVSGLIIRTQPSGNKYYYVQYRRTTYVKRRGTGEEVYEMNTTRLRLGRTDYVSLAEARKKASTVINAAQDAASLDYYGEDVRQFVLKKLHELDKTPAELRQEREEKRQCPTVEEFIDGTYGPLKQGLKSFSDGREVRRLKFVLTVLSKDSKQGCKGDPRFNLLDKKLYDIGSNLIRDWRTERLSRDSNRTGNPPSRVTVMRELNMMHALFAEVARRGHVDTNPVTGNQLTEKSKRKVRPLDPDEEDRLLEALLKREGRLCTDGEAEFPDGAFKDLIRPIILLAMHTGMRFGELSSLKWNDVDLTKLKTGAGRNQIELMDTKSDEPLELPLNDFAADILRTWYKQRATIDPDAYVFPDKKGNRLRDIRRFWLPVFQNARLPKGFRFHDLRHHFASKLVMSGVPLFAVQRLLNHSSPEMTQRYAKFSPTWMDQTVGLLDRDEKWHL